jgi:putative tricarboxylic transport membrane protein
MRRDTFLHSLAALAAAGLLPSAARAAANLKMMIPANPGGGWDSTGRALGKALQEAGAATAVTYENKGGAAGAIGLAQFVNAAKGDGNALMMMGQVMIGGIITGKPPVSVTQCTPIARLTSEYTCLRAAGGEPAEDDEGCRRADEEGPGQRQVGRRLAGVDRAHHDRDDRARGRGRRLEDQLRALPWRWRGHGGHPGQQRHRRRPAATASSSSTSRAARCVRSPWRPRRARRASVPTLKELGINVELGNWRGVYGAPGITAEQRKALTDMVVKATKTKGWAEALEKNNWTPR